MRSPRVIEKRKKIKGKWLWRLLRIGWYSEVWQFPLRWASLISQQEPSTRVFDPSTSVKISASCSSRTTLSSALPATITAAEAQCHARRSTQAARKQRATSATQLAPSILGLFRTQLRHGAAQPGEFGARLCQCLPCIYQRKGWRTCRCAQFPQLLMVKSMYIYCTYTFAHSLYVHKT